MNLEAEASSKIIKNISAENADLKIQLDESKQAKQDLESLLEKTQTELDLKDNEVNLLKEKVPMHSTKINGILMINKAQLLLTVTNNQGSALRRSARRRTR